MSVFLVSEDRAWSHELISSLVATGLSVDPIFTATTAAMRFRRKLPELVLVDLLGQERGVARMLRDLRQNHPAAQVPVLILSDEEVPRSLRRLSLVGTRSRTRDLAGAVQEINQIIARKSSGLPSGQPHHYAMDVLGRVWREELSGALISERSGKVIEVSQGGLLNPANIRQLRLDLGSSFQFSPQLISGRGDSKMLGRFVWENMRKLTSSSFLQNKGKMLLKARVAADRVRSLPLPAGTRQLLSGKSSAPLTDRLAAVGLVETDVCRDVQILCLLGLYRLIPAPPKRSVARPPMRRTPSGSSPAPRRRSTTVGNERKAPEKVRPRTGNPDGAKQSPELKAKLELRRLRRELEILSKSNDWTVLGIQPTNNASLIAEAGERMRGRYVRDATDPLYPLYQQILKRINEAIGNLNQLLEVYRFYGQPEDPGAREEVAFYEGLVSLRRQNLPRALRCFNSAYDLHVRSARNLAYMGWLRFLTASDRSAVAEDSLEFLQLSEALRANVPQTQFFLATIENELGQTKNAAKRLERLIKNGQADKDSRELHRQVRRRLGGRK